MKFDLLSFLLGFFGGLVVLVIRRFFKGVLPKIFNSASNWVLNYKQKNLNVIEDQFKSATYQRAQNAHLQNNLFPLKEIIVPPFFTAPPKNKLNHASEPIYSVTDRLFPFTPGYLELASQFSISKISLSDAIANGVNLVLIGHPGSGKTTALADLVSQICSCPQKTGQLAAFFPIYMHVHDIVLSNDDSNSWNLLLDSLQGLNTAHRNQINKLLLNIKNVFSRKILFVLDGMDELSPQDFDQYTKLLKRLLDDNPAIQVLTTATPEYLGNLLDLGFSPLGITAWGRREIDHFLKNWITQWDRNITTNPDPEYPFSGLYTLIKNWLQREKLFLSPLDWTLIVWSAFGGDGLGNTAFHAMEAYIRRLTGKTIPRTALEKIASHMIRNQTSAISLKEARKILASHKPQRINQEKMVFLEDQELSVPNKKHGKPRKEKRVSSAEKSLQILLDTGLMVLYSNDRITFRNMLVISYLASFDCNDPGFFNETNIKWSGSISTLRYCSAQNKHTDKILDFLNAPVEQTYQNLLIVGKWLYSPKKYKWRDRVFEKLGYLLATTDLPKFQLVRIASALLTSNDPSIQLLFAQLLNSPRTQTRLIACLGTAALQNENCTNKLAGLLHDPSPEVRLSAALALTHLSNPYSHQIVDGILKNAEEEQRIIAAEKIGGFDNNLEILVEYLNSEDMLSRRAALSGLARIKDDSSINIIEQLANEDSQWIIRNLAAEILKEIQNPIHPGAPERLTNPDQSAWLIEYASQIGQGISPDIFPYDVLFHAAQHGSMEQQEAALDYLLLIQDTQINQLLEDIMNNSANKSRETAALHLWLHSIKTTREYEAANRKIAEY